MSNDPGKPTKSRHKKKANRPASGRPGKKQIGRQTGHRKPDRTRPQNPPTKKTNRKKNANRKPAKRHRAAGTESRTLPPERLQKVLARAGFGSRRAIERRIEAGEILVAGRPAPLGATVGEGDRITIDGRHWRVAGARQAHETLIYHKPEGELTTRSDPGGRATVFDKLPRPASGRWIAIGRLDINTAGLLLLTTDGELANRMMHPKGRVDREYLCRIRGEVRDEQIERLLKGVELDDGPAHFTDLVAGETTAGHSWFTVVLMEGRQREVRRLWEAVGATVARLKRVRFGPVFLPARLRTGQFERLTAADHRVLREDVGLAAVARELVLESDD